MTTRISGRLAAAAVQSVVFGTAGAVTAYADPTIVVANVNDRDMVMQQLSPVFEKRHPEIHVRSVAPKENYLRQRVTADIATRVGSSVS